MSRIRWLHFLRRIRWHDKAKIWVSLNYSYSWNKLKSKLYILIYVTELSRNSKQFQKWFIVQWFFRLTALIVSCWLNRQIIVKAISFFGSVTARKGHQIQLPGFAFIKSVHKDQIITVNEKKKRMIERSSPCV